jgi:hypothetical protein
MNKEQESSRVRQSHQEWPRPGWKHKCEIWDITVRNKPFLLMLGTDAILRDVRSRKSQKHTFMFYQNCVTTQKQANHATCMLPRSPRD